MTQDLRLAIDRKGALSCLTVAYLLLLSVPASAEDRLHKLFACPAPVPDCIGKWRPDDYCAKKTPCNSVPLCFGCDDYCRKKAPCVDAPLCFSCDDYCKKRLPKVCIAPQCPDLKSALSGQHCGRTACDEPCGGFNAHSAEVRLQHRAADSQQAADEQRPAKPQRLPVVIAQSSDFDLTK